MPLPQPRHLSRQSGNPPGEDQNVPPHGERTEIALRSVPVRSVGLVNPPDSVPASPWLPSVETYRRRAPPAIAPSFQARYRPALSPVAPARPPAFAGFRPSHLSPKV